MPLQNRVTPFGDIVATAHRGRFTGNRGIIHDPQTRSLLKRRWSSPAWLICVCEFRGRRREVMSRRSWTELFFMDEATALAAGHRPCFYCRRSDANAFRAAWAKGNRVPPPSAREIDNVLHTERLDRRQKRQHVLRTQIDRLPDGSMLATGGDAFVIKDGGAWRWAFAGYTRSLLSAADVMLLTPPSTVRALRAGYKPQLDASLMD
jgi:hypothetical protein